MVQEVLGSVPFPINLTENIMRQVADLKPTPPPVAKPLLPWGAFGVATLLFAMLLGASHQYLARFQKPYSFEAVAEPMVEIVDTAILLDIDSKPDVRNQIGRSVSTDKNIGAGLQTAETPLVSDTQRNSLGPAPLQWTRKADMPTARTGFATSVVNGKVFVIGGNIQLKRGEFGVLSASTVEMYDPETDTWEQKANMPTARSGVSVSVVDGKIYAIGGTNLKTIQVPRGYSSESEELATVEMYDPVTDTWTQKADMPIPKKTMTCVVNGKIYAIGGWLTTNEKPHLETVEVYDPATDTWTTAESMNCARCSAAIGVVNGEIYAIGGLSSSPIQEQSDLYLSNVEVFNPKTNQWQKGTEMSAPKALHTASVIDGKIYVIGGYFKKDMEFKKLATIEIYDPTTDRWIQEPDMPIGKWGHKTEVIDGQIYIFGGGPVTSVQVYDPRGTP